MKAPTCRFCSSPLSRTVVDLGSMPLANSYLEEWQLTEEEPRYPLHARVCDDCLLVQVDDVVPPQAIFRDYAYFSSYSDSWVEHARRFAGKAIADLGLGPQSLVLEVASNDGYLLRHFRNAGVPVLGIEPASNVAAVALEAGIPTEVRFFGSEVGAQLASEGRGADLLVANNVLAHVPDLNDFVSGLAAALAPSGVLSIEVPHLLELLDKVQFDTIYHEHFSYFSLHTTERVLEAHGLTVFDVERLPTHGGSLRIWVAHRAARIVPTERLATARSMEADAGIWKPDRYEQFADRVQLCREMLRAFLSEASTGGGHVAAYGAAAKGNTLLNYCGLTQSDIPYVADRSPHKQGLFLPGSHIPVVSPNEILRTKPDHLLILPWNLREEIVRQMTAIRAWGGRFVTAVPGVAIFA